MKGKHQISVKSHTMSTITSTKRVYKVLNPEGDQFGTIKLSPSTPACTKQVLAPLELMLAHASNREALGDGEFNLLAEALKRFNITVDELFDAFWKAYADPFVSQGKIEFRHLWKHIKQEREKEPVPQYQSRRLN